MELDLSRDLQSRCALCHLSLCLLLTSLNNLPSCRSICADLFRNTLEPIASLTPIRTHTASPTLSRTPRTVPARIRLDLFRNTPEPIVSLTPARTHTSSLNLACTPKTVPARIHLVCTYQPPRPHFANFVQHEEGHTLIPA
jgi:hypothetical protein